MEIEQEEKRYMKHLEVLNRSSETILGYGKDIKSFRRFDTVKYNGPVYVEDITRDDIESFLYYLKEERKLAPASISRAQYTLRSFFNYLYGNNYIRSNPTAMLEAVKIPQKERPFLSQDESLQLANAIKNRIIKTVILFLFYTGLRISECCNLEIGDVNLTENIVNVRAGKGNKDRIVPINTTLHEILEDYVENVRPTIDMKRFFATHKTGKLSPQYVNREIKIAVKKLKWDKQISAHSLRHSYASALISKNVNIVHVSKLLGHSSVKVTSIYAHSNIEQLREAVENL